MTQQHNGAHVMHLLKVHTRRPRELEPRGKAETNATQRRKASTPPNTERSQTTADGQLQHTTQQGVLAPLLGHVHSVRDEPLRDVQWPQQNGQGERDGHAEAVAQLRQEACTSAREGHITYTRTNSNRNTIGAWGLNCGTLHAHCDGGEECSNTIITPTHGQPQSNLPQDIKTHHHANTQPATNNTKTPPPVT